MLENSQLLAQLVAHLVLILDVMFAQPLEVQNAQLAWPIITPSLPNVLDVMKVITQLLAQTEVMTAKLAAMLDAQLVLLIPQSTNVLLVRKVTSSPVVTRLAINAAI